MSCTGSKPVDWDPDTTVISECQYPFTHVPCQWLYGSGLTVTPYTDCALSSCVDTPGTQCPSGYTYSAACDLCYLVDLTPVYQCTRWSDDSCGFEIAPLASDSYCQAVYAITHGFWYYSRPAGSDSCECCPDCDASYHWSTPGDDCVLDGSDCAAGTYWNGEECSADLIQPRHDFQRHPMTRQLFVAYRGSGGDMRVDRYSSALVDTVEATVVVDADTSCTAPRLQIDEAGIQRLLYLDGTAVRLAESRDNGRTWTLATTVVTSGYTLATYALGTALAGRPMAVVMLWASSKWYVTVGRLAVGGAWSWTAPAEAVDDAAAIPASLIQRPDGIWELLYTALPNVKTIIRCSNLGSDGSGVWA